MISAFARSQQMVERVAAALGPVAHEVVFVGGAVLGLLVDDPASVAIRATLDVDMVAEVASRIDYYALADRLRARGFVEDSRPEAPICRWVVGGVTVDVMPADTRIFGFGNPWYALVLRTATLVALADGREIRVICPPCFLATKMVAFGDRGQNDPWSSHDIEDVITLVDNRSSLEQEVAQADAALREFLSLQLRELLLRPDAGDIIAGHLPGDAAGQARLPKVRSRLRSLVMHLPGP